MWGPSLARRGTPVNRALRASSHRINFPEKRKKEICGVHVVRGGVR
jgi:hypothetical protein